MTPHATERGIAGDFAFLGAAERLALGGALAQIEALEAEGAQQKLRLRASAARPPPRAAVPPVAELEGAAVAADPGLVGQYVREGRPVLVRGLAAALGWPACDKWASAERFCGHYGGVPFKLTELRMPAGMGRQRGLPLRLPLGAYARYADGAAADFPWYCFGDDFQGPRAAFLADYGVPPPWADDLYALSAELRAAFPAYRYMVIGGVRTGSNLHVDPDFTAAWNALLSGAKRWALFPPGADGAALGAAGSSTPPLCWWLDHYPRLAAAQAADPALGMLECEQRPGDIIFVPPGWWHCVLNTVDSGLAIAVTHNSLPPAALGAELWARVASENPWLAAALARELAAHASAAAVREVPAPTRERAAAWLREQQARREDGEARPSSERGRPPAVLFFSVDGVLAARGSEPGGMALREGSVAALARVVRETSAELVLTAPWRASEGAKAQLSFQLARSGLGFGRAVTTAEMPGGPTAQLASQILDFTARPGTAVERWAVVDALDPLGGKGDCELSLMQTILRARLVRTEILDEATADRLIAILNEADGCADQID